MSESRFESGFQVGIGLRVYNDNPKLGVMDVRVKLVSMRIGSRELIGASRPRLGVNGQSGEAVINPNSSEMFSVALMEMTHELSYIITPQTINEKFPSVEIGDIVIKDKKVFFELEVSSRNSKAILYSDTLVLRHISKGITSEWVSTKPKRSGAVSLGEGRELDLQFLEALRQVT